MSLKETLSNESVRTFVAWFYYFWFENLLFKQLEYSTTTKVPKSVFKILEKPIENIESELDCWWVRSHLPIFQKINVLSSKFFQQVLSDRIWDSVGILTGKMKKPLGFGVKEQPIVLVKKLEILRRLSNKYYLLGFPTRKNTRRGFS